LEMRQQCWCPSPSSALKLSMEVSTAAPQYISCCSISCRVYVFPSDAASWRSGPASSSRDQKRKKKGGTILFSFIRHRETWTMDMRMKEHLAISGKNLVLTTDYRSESRTGTVSCFASTDSWFETRNRQKQEVCNSGTHDSSEWQIYNLSFLLYCKPKWHNKANRWEMVLATVWHTIQ
jgi:uncharacterized protein (DUF2141 family)